MKHIQETQWPFHKASIGKHFFKNAYNQLLKKVAVIIFLLCLSANAISQLHISLEPSDYPPGTVIPANPVLFPIVLPAVQLGEIPAPITMTAYDAVEPTSWTITVNSCPGGIELSTNGQLTMNGTCAAGIHSFEVQVTDNTGIPATQPFQISVFEEERDGFGFVHVLDRSGSMTLNACPGSSTECQMSRWEYLKTAVGLFNTSLQGFSVPDDRIGAILFNNNTTEWNNSLIPVDTDPPGTTQSEMDDFLAEYNPTNLTAMGDGILDGLDLLDAQSNHKNIILFTDGMQNVSPLVTGSGSDLAINGTQLNSTDTRIYCIGINATNPAYTLLQDIAHETGGEAYYNTPQPGDNQADLTSAFYDAMIENILHGSSPQNIDYRYGTFPASAPPVLNRRQIATGTAEETFVLNKNVPFAMFKVLSPATPNGIRNVVILKNGTMVTDKAEITTTPHFTVANFDFPFTDYAGNMITSEGEWTLRITGLTGSKYETSATVDDHFLDVEPKVEVHNYEVGEPINISLNIKYNGEAITDSASVQAIVLKPGEDLGSLLANAKGSNPKDSEGNYDVSTGKYESLLSNPDFFNALIPKERILDLTHTGDGDYSVVFNDTEEAGPYRIILKLKGETKMAGIFERSITRCAMLTFAKAEFLSASEIRILENPDGDFPLQLSIKPRNKFGHLMGPGYGSMLTIKVGNDQLTDFIDRGDGTYIYNIPGGAIGQRPNVSINFRGADIFEGKVSTEGPVDEPQYTIWFYIVIGILILILIIKRLSSKGSLKKVPNWLIILLLLILIVIAYLSQQGIITL